VARRLLESEFHVLLEFGQLLLQLANLKLRLLQLPGHRAELAFEVVDSDRQSGLVLPACRTAIIIYVGRGALPKILRNNDARRGRRFRGVGGKRRK
jgi:hypothetical protein